MKKSAKVLLYCGLDCGILEFFWSTVLQKRWRLERMQIVIQKSGILDSFLHEAAQNFKLLSSIQDQIYKITNL
jgi:hypothetical protein